MDYVTFDIDGNLTGCYRQDLHPSHEAAYLVVDEAIADCWTSYRMNAARDGVEEVPAAPPPTAAVPQQVTRRQALQALLLAGALDNVQPLIDAIVDPLERRMAQIEYDESQTFERHRPLVISIGGALGLDLDALFTTAATL